MQLDNSIHLFWGLYMDDLAQCAAVCIRGMEFIKPITRGSEYVEALESQFGKVEV